jgi:hypothetical protein
MIIFNEEFLVNATHQVALITSLPLTDPWYLLPGSHNSAVQCGTRLTQSRCAVVADGWLKLAHEAVKPAA